MKNTVRKGQPVTPSTAQLSRAQEGASHWVAGDSRLLTRELGPILGHDSLFSSPLPADLTGPPAGGRGGAGLPCNPGNEGVAPVAQPAVSAFLTGQ